MIKSKEGLCMAMLTGGSKNDHAAVARSDILTVAYVATTQNLPHHRIKYDITGPPTRLCPSLPAALDILLKFETKTHVRPWTKPKRSRR